jgi:D-3-phosphoglycerate dehydrogenase
MGGGDSILSMIYENIIDMLDQVSHILGKTGINIIHMVNNSRGNIAVTLMDVEAKINGNTQFELSKIAGMLKLRII